MTSSLDYRPDIDGLHAVAVLAVVLYHGGFALPGGFVGVDVFFVISGFLITANILREIEYGEFTLGSFYRRRIRRLLPALFCVVSVVTITGVVLFLPSDLNDLSRSSIAAISGVSNWYFYLNVDYFDPSSALRPLLHTWSLGVEEQFYFIWPVIILLSYRLYARPRRAIFVSLAAMSLASFLAGTLVLKTDPKQAFYLPHTRIWELATGALLAFAPVVRQKLLMWVSGAVGFVLLVVAFVFFDSLMSFPGPAAALPCVGAALLMWPTSDWTPTKALLSWQPVMFVGKISYSLYLWHWPVLVFFLYQSAHPPTAWWERLSVLVVIFSLAFASWKLVEQPFRRRVIEARTVFPAAFAASAFIGLVSALIIFSQGLPYRFTSDQLAIINDVPERGGMIKDGASCSGRDVSDPCVIGSLERTPTWAVLGDSHAETLLQSLDSGFRQRNLSAIVYTYPGCPFILNVKRLDTGADCGSFTAKVMKKLSELDIKHVLIQDRANAYLVGKPFDNGEGGVEPGGDFPVSTSFGKGASRLSDVERQLNQTLQALLDDKREVFYFLAPPEVGWNVPQRVVQQLRSGGLMPTTALNRYFERNETLMNVLKPFGQHPGFRLVPSYRPFCSEVDNRCHTVDPSGLLYTDTDHLSAIGARRLVSFFFELCDRIMRNAHADSQAHPSDNP